jgi:transposase
MNDKERSRPMQGVSTLGLDLAKNVFQLHGVDADGNVAIRKKLRRGAVLGFLRSLPPCLVGMEACATAHDWAREIQLLGHEVRLMPPSYVKAYVKRGKNDAADAEAICEAVTRPSMRFVPVKSAEQQGVLTVHRSRDLLVRQRTMLLNAIRGLVGEFGIIAAQGPARVMHLIAELHADGAAGLPDAARSAVLCLARQLEALAEQIRVLDRRLLAWHRQDQASQRLASIPGVGVLTATALSVSPTRAWVASSRPSSAWCPVRAARNVWDGSRRWAIVISESCW